ncbi:hypothetical protein BLOT_005999 [Blomia tropicalis]|nr:hypothetical protein BLOT_005999 [Blomia tropicalis]
MTGYQEKKTKNHFPIFYNYDKISQFKTLMYSPLNVGHSLHIYYATIKPYLIECQIEITNNSEKEKKAEKVENVFMKNVQTVYRKWKQKMKEESYMNKRKFDKIKQRK